MGTTTQKLVRTLGPLAALAAVWLLFAWRVPGGRFTALDNQKLMLLQTAVVGTAAMGATLIIASGGIDLSIGSTVALCTMVIAWLINHGWPPVVAGLVGGAGVAVAVGGLIGSMVTGRWLPPPLPRLEMPPFIVTLGMLGILRGLAQGLGHEQPIYPKEGAAGVLLDLMSLKGTGLPGFLGWLPAGVWVFLLTAAAVSVLLTRTVLGRRALAIGDNATAARYAGVPVVWTKVAVYALGVGCGGLAAVMQFSYLTVGDPGTAAGLELSVIASCVIGGASLSGGSASVLGTMVGALLMTVVANGCTKLELQTWVQTVVTGVIIVGAVALDQWRRR
jgi:ribose/xylose/arabinose/galactoside ABC-type transport system permease subunit